MAPGRYVGGMVPCAYLRAFEPLEAFPPLEREWWGEYVSKGDGITLREAVDTEDRIAATRLLTGRGRLSQDAALVRRVGGRIHLCPLQLELRAATALRAFRATMPSEVHDAFVPDTTVEQQLHRLADTVRPPHIRDAPWAPPLPWFVPFAASERHYVDPPEGRGARLTYLTTAGQALDRLERAIRIVEETLEDGEDVLLELADVADWVESFHRDSLIELDYGRVAAQFPPEVLSADRTCEEVWAALEGLEEHDLLTAAAYYGVARSRWSSLRHRQFAN